MKIKWLNYFKFIPLINLVAYIFYPRIKIDGLYDYLSIYYGCLGLMDDNDIDIELMINNVSKILVDLFNEYKDNVNIGSSSSLSLSSISSSFPTSQVRDE